QILASEAVVANVADRTLCPSLVFGMLLALRVDVKTARLRVLEESVDDAWLERIGGVHDRLGVIRYDDGEHAAVERPRRLTCLDRRIGALFKAWIDEPVAREMRREDPCTKSPPTSALVGLELRHPARVDVDLFPRLAVGDRNRRYAAAEVELADRKAMQRRVRHVDSAPMK